MPPVSERAAAIDLAANRIDEASRGIAARAGAVEEIYPSVLGRKTLQQVDFFDSFPGRAIAIDEFRNEFVPPALCYFLFEHLSGAVLQDFVTMTTTGTCARNDEVLRPPFRLRFFSMREIVFVGSHSEVERMRQELLQMITAYAKQSRLKARVEVATDPFFLPASRGKAILQRLKGLKYELVIDSGNEPVALASFNLHEDFFGRRMEIRLADGSFAHSGCVAFGLDRWAAALGEHAS